jgi:hypothetical protein
MLYEKGTDAETSSDMKYLSFSPLATNSKSEPSEDVLGLSIYNWLYLVFRPIK